MRLDELEDGVGVGAVDVGLGEDVEFDAIAIDEGADVVGAPLLLRAKLMAQGTRTPTAASE